MAVFHSLGYIPVRMDLGNMAVSEGVHAIIPAAVFNSLLGILSRPVFFFFNHQFSLKGLIQYRYSEFAEETIYQWFPDKIQELHLQHE